jgi:hypothetical protein
MATAKDDGRPDDGTEEPEETVLISGFDARTKEVTVLKPAADGVEAAVLRPALEGRPLTGDLVRLTPRPDFPLLAGLKTVLRHPDHRPPGDDAAPPRAASRSLPHQGPPRVSSEAYRRGWEAVFGRREGAGAADPDDPDVN